MRCQILQQFMSALENAEGRLTVACTCIYYTSVKIIKNEVGCRDDTMPKTVDTRRHCEEE